MKNLIASHLLQIKRKINGAEARFERLPNSVQLIAASKAQDILAIKSAIATGQRAFGESYVQEYLEKIQSLRDQEVEWHFIGRIQANKVKIIANNFAWVHSLSKLKTAISLNHFREKTSLTALNVCIQVNLEKETNKSGVYLENLISLAKLVDRLPYLRLRGLMAIPKPEIGFDDQRKKFKKLRLVLEELQKIGLQLDTLSMGMSDDFEAGIAEGATFVRIGTAIFGKRINIL